MEKLERLECLQREQLLETKKKVTVNITAKENSGI